MHDQRKKFVSLDSLFNLNIFFVYENYLQFKIGTIVIA